MKPAKLFMVLPAYNEEENLPALLESCERIFELLACAGHERAYVIVDDGSHDGTATLIREHQTRLPIAIVTHNLNQGLGPTIRDGLRRAADLAANQDIIFTMDADNTHPPGLMIRMTQHVLEGNDLVIASRYRHGARLVGLSRIRKLMSFGARLLFRLLFPIPGVRDYTCGYRAYRASVLKEAFRRYGDSLVEARGFQCMPDILLKLARMKIIMNEVPMVLRYDLKGGDSKMRVGATVLATLRLMIRRRFERLPTAA
jgi:dolichol-phosphate mannosyltransferase